MADYQLNAQGQNINYLNGGGSDFEVIDPTSGYPMPVARAMGLFLNGGTGVDGKSYPKIDMSLWDQATMCGTCHVGGPFYEQDRQGSRLPARVFTDWSSAMLGKGVPRINPLTTTVWESYDPATGAQTSKPTFAPWVYPMFVGNNPANAPIIAPNGWGPAGPNAKGGVDMPDPNSYTGAMISLSPKQLMMPNVKEMDCLFCHLKGYDNVSASVMTQAGNLAFAPGAGAGMFDMTPISPTYMGYNGSPNSPVSFTNMSSAGMGNVAMVSLSGSALTKMVAKPDSDNCMKCHATRTLKDLPEMFGTTGTSNGFLSSAPMIFDPANGMGPLGKRMVAYDINAPFKFPGEFSDPINGANVMSYMMPGMPWPEAMGYTPFRNGSFDPRFDLGGGNAGQSGPLYYYNTTTTPDQDVMKRSTMPFPRAEWFKRGDAWQEGKDVHGFLGCGGCHYTGDTTHKNQCDPGRGHDMMSGIQDGVPPLKERNLIDGETPDKHDTRNTVKRCEFCHLTGKDYYGNSIDTFGAPNPTAKHQAAGLTANVVQIVDKVELHGTFGGQGVPQTTDYTTLKRDSAIGNHLDVMDCTVCHVQKETMAVRTLDATSGMRFPSIIGTDPTKGMMGLFEDPATIDFNNYAAAQYNQMYQAMGQPAPFVADASGKMIGPDGAPAIGGKLQPWKPLMSWQKLGNMELPLTTNLGPGANFSNGGNSNLQFRRKIYLSNPIVAAIWNNYTSNVDANGDGATGGILNNGKASLDGYRDIFSGELLDKNNAQGFDEPIFDPWIMRDLKEGFNFGPAPLSVISVGFGDPTTMPSAMAYDMSGNGKFADPGTGSNYWKYVSVWSGAVVFTEPYQIDDYRKFRTAMGGKSWMGTELALVGDPFTVTHGIQRTTTYAKGKNCTDCHASGAGFFNGDFTMTGTAIPADRSYNPTAQLQTVGNPYSDANSYLPALTADGETVRNPGMPGMDSESNMMQRPLEPYRVKALKGQMRTAFEGFNKLGQPRTTEFQESNDTYTWTVPMQRADVLYPHEKNADGSELRIYCKVSDDCAADSSKLMTGREYAAYLETAAVADKTALGIGVNPVADIATIAGQTANEGSSVISVTQNAPVTLAANTAVNTQGIFTYTWQIDDGGSIPAGASPSYTFTKTGTYTVTLRVTDEEGKVAIIQQKVSVAAPSPLTIGAYTTDPTTKVTTIPVTTSGGTKLRVTWNDGGAATTFDNISNGTMNLTHTYLRSSKYAVTGGYRYNTSVTLYNGTTILSNKTVTVIVPQ